jgi:hypothetical protein
MTEREYQPETDNKEQIFDVFEELRKLPDQSDSMLTDVYFSDFPVPAAGSFGSTASCRCITTNNATSTCTWCPAGGCSTWTVRKPRRVRALSGFGRRQVHGFPRIDEHPFVVLAIDVPRRRPDDIVFVNPEDGDARSFMARNN